MSKEFWEQKWNDNQTEWDLGQVSPPLLNYINQLTNKDKDLKILIPGCGNAYEAEYLYAKGFKNTFIVEIAKGAIESFTERNPDFPKENIIHANFFDIKGNFDIVIEQTFFCAINPDLRKNYVEQMTNILKTDGKIVGVLFNADFAGGPPFGGQKDEYVSLFSNNFNIDVMDQAHNSIGPRQGRELFIILRKK